MESTPILSSFSRIVRAIILGIAWLFLAIAALAVLGTFLPSVPYLGMASILIPSLPLLTWLMALVGGVLIYWLAKGTTVKRTATAAALLTILGTFGITSNMSRAYKAHGASVSMFSSANLGAAPTIADTVIQFGSFDGQSLYADLYKPSGKAALVPILINVHGGAWVKGTRAESATDQKWFAEKGWLVFSIDYTLSTDEKHYWNSLHSQIGCFLTWLQAHASQYGGDTSKIILMGGSAGGNLALNAASLSGQNALASTCGGTPPRVSAVVGIVPGVDPVDIMKNDYPSIGPSLQREIPKYPGGTPAEYPERYKAIQSATYLSPNNPPMLIFSALDDHLVNYKSIDNYAEQARKMGISVEHLRLPHGDHGAFSILASIGNQGFRQVTFNWLTKLGLAPVSR